MDSTIYQYLCAFQSLLLSTNSLFFCVRVHIFLRFSLSFPFSPLTFSLFIALSPFIFCLSLSISSFIHFLSFSLYPFFFSFSYIIFLFLTSLYSLSPLFSLHFHPFLAFLSSPYPVNFFLPFLIHLALLFSPFPLCSTDLFPSSPLILYPIVLTLLLLPPFSLSSLSGAPVQSLFFPSSLSLSPCSLLIILSLTHFITPPSLSPLFTLPVHLLSCPHPLFFSPSIDFYHFSLLFVILLVSPLPPRLLPDTRVLVIIPPIVWSIHQGPYITPAPQANVRGATMRKEAETAMPSRTGYCFFFFLFFTYVYFFFLVSF